MDLTLLLLSLIAAETTYLSASHLKRRTYIDKGSILIDTSVLIDGRIESLARSGIITAPIRIPQSVVRELQYMADKADHDKRERAREGLGMIETLQSIEHLDVTVFNDTGIKESGVDERLVELAIREKARLCTTDYNLNKAARVQGITVININEIAHALRVVYLPGEMVALTVVQPGQERDQGVGYLDDGTMVVVDNAKNRMNEQIEVQITRVLQTAAGKMMFARLLSAPQKAGQMQAAEKNAKRSYPHTKSEATIAADRSHIANTPSKGDQKKNSTGKTSKKPYPQTTSKVKADPPHIQTKSTKKSYRRRSMTDRAEDYLVDLLNDQK